MSEVNHFKKHGWKPEELRFYAVCWGVGVVVELDSDDIIDGYGVLRLKLIQK